MKSKILYFYPFVHINIKDKILLYNTLNGKSLITNKFIVNNIIRELIKNPNKLIVLKSDLLENNEVNEFVTKIVNLNMGNLQDSVTSKKLPVQFINKLKIQKEVELLKEKNDRSIGEEILNYLNEVTIYLNGDCTLKCKSCDYGYKQITTCKKGEAKEEIEWNLLIRILNIFERIPVETLHILGGNLFNYSCLSELVSFLQKRKKTTIFHINAQNLINNNKKIKKIDSKNIILNVHINNYENLDFTELFNGLKRDYANYLLTFIIESEDQLDILENIVENLDQTKIEIKPVYNGSNLEFFEENVFINENILLEEKQSLHEITQKQGVNLNFFGSIFIDYTGDIYSAIKGKPLGNLNSISIQEAIFIELKNNERWRLLRQNVEPCSKCYYNLLCPSISNYEIEIGKFDLCDIYFN